jgi:glucosylceramidase
LLLFYGGLTWRSQGLTLKFAQHSCTIAALLLFNGTLRAQKVQVYRTTSDLASALKAEPATEFSTVVKPAALTILVEDTQRYQTMDGFGASLTDGSAWLLQEKLSVPSRQRAMIQLFDPVHGAGLSFLRQPIGSTDLSRDIYSFDDMPVGESDPKLQHFSVKHDQGYIFPVIRQALALNPAITVMVTPWSAPAWMKEPQTMDGGRLREDAMTAYSSYIVDSVQAFQQAGVPVKYLTIQNEPLNETKNYPGTLMPEEQAARLVGSYLGPGLHKAGLKTGILGYDHNWDHPEYPIAMLSDPVAAPYVFGTALHCYGGDVNAQDAIHERFPNKGIWLTECSGGTWQRESPLLATAHLLIEATRHWAKSVSLWAVALDSDHGPHAGGCKTCRGLVTVDLHTSPPMVSYNGDYYALAHAAKFVRPGATRIGSTSFGRDGLETVAFQNIDGTVALLALNNRTELTPFTVRWHGRAFTASLPPGALATYSWKPSQAMTTPEAQ